MHAETCIAGADLVVLELTGKCSSVTSFSEQEYEPVSETTIV